MYVSGFLHAGTHCTLSLGLPGGPQIDASGAVESCVLISGRTHAACVALSRRLPAALAGLNESEVPPAERDARVEGVVLCVASIDLIGALLASMLSRVGLQVVRESATGPAYDQLKQRWFDAVIWDLAAGSQNEEAARAQIRQGGYSGPIVFLLEPEQASGEPPIDGLYARIFTPAMPEEVVRTTLGLLQTSRPVEEVPTSALLQDPSNSDLTQRFRRSLAECVAKLTNGVTADCCPSVRACCTYLVQIGKPLQLDRLTELAATARKQLDASQSVAESLPAIRQVQNLCQGILKRFEASDGARTAA